MVHAPDGRQFRIEPVHQFDDRMARQERERQQIARNDAISDFVFRFAVGVVGSIVVFFLLAGGFAIMVNAVRPASNAPTIINPGCKAFC